jgi:hypothetical protein
MLAPAKAGWVGLRLGASVAEAIAEELGVGLSEGVELTSAGVAVGELFAADPAGEAEHATKRSGAVATATALLTLIQVTGVPGRGSRHRARG